ncbi:MAG: DUF3080 family protein [Halioglobus sp.]
MPPTLGKTSTRDTGATRQLAMLLLLAALLAGGCARSDPDAPFDNYLSRLARTLGVAASPPPMPGFPRPPRSGGLRLAIPAGKLHALDFLGLHGCDLQVTVGKRNSSLGRLAPASQLLLLELEFLRLAPACIAQLDAEGREDLAATLAGAADDKRNQLPALIFNATLGGDEYRAFWQQARAPGTYPASGGATSAAALLAINAMAERWLGGDYRADGTEFELLLGEVAGGGGGVLLQAMLRQQAWLAAANDVIDTRIERGPLCATGIRHRAADILPNVVRKFFIGELQPQAAALDRSRYQLLPAVATLESRLAPVLPEAYRQWLQTRNRLIDSAIRAPREHVEALKRIEAPCGESETIAPRGG